MFEAGQQTACARALLFSRSELSQSLSALSLGALMCKHGDSDNTYLSAWL